MRTARRCFALILLSLAVPLIGGCAGYIAALEQPPEGMASIYVYWRESHWGPPPENLRTVLGLSLFANGEHQGPLAADEYTRILVPAGTHRLQLAHRPNMPDELTFLGYRLLLKPFDISAEANSVHYVEFRYVKVPLEEIDHPEEGRHVFVTWFREIEPDVAIPILGRRFRRL